MSQQLHLLQAAGLVWVGENSRMIELIIAVVGLIVGVVGLIVAAIALIVGFRHVRELREQVTELKRQTEQARAHTTALDTIRRELPTRYIGLFPDYLQEIVDLFEKASKKIIIFCDFPAYGSFSHPKKFFDYRQKLEQKLNDGLDVQLTCLNKDGRMEITRDQFLRRPWVDWTRDPQNADRLERLLKRHSKTTTNEKEFIDLLEVDDAGMLNSMSQAGAKVLELGKTIPLFYWVVDDEEAVFAIIVLSDKAVEYGFRTSDQQLINALNEMRDHYHRQSRSESQSPVP